MNLDGLPDPAFGNNGHAVIDLPSTHDMATKIIPLPDEMYVLELIGRHFRHVGKVVVRR